MNVKPLRTPSGKIRTPAERIGAEQLRSDLEQAAKKPKYLCYTKKPRFRKIRGKMMFNPFDLYCFYREQAARCEDDCWDLRVMFGQPESECADIQWQAEEYDRQADFWLSMSKGFDKMYITKREMLEYLSRTETRINGSLFAYIFEFLLDNEMLTRE